MMMVPNQVNGAVNLVHKLAKELLQDLKNSSVALVVKPSEKGFMKHGSETEVTEKT